VNEPLGLRPPLVTPPGLKPFLVFVAIVVALGLTLALVSGRSREAKEARLDPGAYCAAMNAGQNPSVQPGIDCAGA